MGRVWIDAWGDQLHHNTQEYNHIDRDETVGHYLIHTSEIWIGT